MHTRLATRLGAFVVAATCCQASAWQTASLQADVFHLASGGVLEGELVNAAELPRTSYVVRTSPGAVFTLAAKQVTKVVPQAPAEAEYAALRHTHPDTSAGHWALAEWCREKNLNEQRKQHLERIIELEPDHRAARSVLGYNRIGGQWRTRQEHMEALGKIQHKGEWLYPQEIEIFERKAEATKLRLEWIANVKRWRDWIGGPKDLTARNYLSEISDPAAIPALQQALGENQPDNVRVLYIRALARIGTYDAYMILAERSLADTSDEVRALSLDLLVDHPQPSIVNYYIRQLQSKDNAVVNGAAYALRRFKDDRAVGPLIDVLRTRHKFAIVSGGSGMSATNSNFGSSFSTGSSTKVFQQDINNQAVLDALITLVNGQVGYGFDVDAWKQWYAGQRKNKFVDSRRS